MSMAMEVKQIAALQAETLDRLRNWGSYSSTSTSFDEQKAFVKCEKMTKRVAKSRARASNRDVETTLVEVKMEVAMELAQIWALTPALAGGTESVKVEEEGEEQQVCGICLEDMKKGEQVRAMRSCSHKFHHLCIYQWVNRNPNCPLCRARLLV